MDPTALKFSPTHEWIAVDGDTGTVGISDFAVEQLSDVVYIELPDVGQNLQKGDSFGVIESVKAASDLYMPVSGKVIEVNAGLPEDLAIMSDDPFGKAWIIRIRVSNADDLDSLLDHDAYRSHCDSEAH